MEVHQALAAVLFACLALSSVDEATSASYKCGNECSEAAKKVKSTLDQTVEPCDDFYKFACGNFDKKISDIPAGEGSYNNQVTPNQELIFKLGKKLMEDGNDAGSFETDKKIRKIYAACTNLKQQDILGIEPMKKVISELGGWPVLKDPNWKPAKTWAEVMLSGNKLGLDPDYFIQIDFANTDNGDITFWLNPQWPEVSANTPSKKVTSYKDYMVEAAELFGADPSYARQEMEKVYDFQAELGTLGVDPTKTKGKYPLGDLEKLFIPMGLSVKQFLQTAVGADSNGKKLQDADEVIVYGLKYYVAAAKVFEKTDDKTILNYIIWRAVMSKMTSLGKDARASANKYQTANGVKPVPKWKECLKLVGFNEPWSPLLGAGGSLFIRKHLDTTYVAAFKAMHTTMKKSFADIIDSTRWMDAKTKQMAKSKIQTAKLTVSDAPELSQKKMVDGLFSALSGISSTEHMKNVMAIKKFSFKQCYRIIKNSIAADNWTRNLRAALPYIFINRPTNTITILAGYLVRSIHHSKLPEYMNYGGGAYPFAALLSRSFDNAGINTDASGTDGLWLTDRTTYDNNKRCFQAQYNKTKIPDLPGETLNAKVFREGIFLGNSALRLAYKAYGDYVKHNLNGQQEGSLPGLEKYTPKQMFWIGYGQTSCVVYTKEALKNAAAGHGRFPYSLGAMHVINRKEFATDFQCGADTPMNPTKKCEMW